MNNYKYFANKKCEYYPCHKTDQETFNCLFCYCPLFHLDDCGGNYSIMSNGQKSCDKCMTPHIKDNYQYIVDKLRGEK